MATEQSGLGHPDIGQIYVKFNGNATSGANTIPSVLDLLGPLSLTSYFKVCLHLTSNTSNPLLNHLENAGLLGEANDNYFYDFLCSEASMPGVSFNSVQEMGSYQGVVENFPTMRLFSPFEISLYVDNNFKIIRLFEEWINFINPIYNDKDNGKPAAPTQKGQGAHKYPNQFFRLRYPEEYRRIISVVKFERNFRGPKNTGNPASPPTITYRLIDAYPDQISVIPLTYEGSIITKATVRFLYSRFVIEKNDGQV